MNLYNKVKERASVVNVKMYSKTRIDNLVKALKNEYSDEQFIELLSVIYVLHKMDSKIKEAVIKGNVGYLSDEDFFCLFVNEVYISLQEYDFSIGYYVGYIGKRIYYAFSDKCKSAYFYVTGNIPKEKRNAPKQMTYDVFENQFGNQVSYDKTVLIDEVHDCIDDLPEIYRQVVKLRFFSNPYSVVPFAEIAKQMNKKPAQVRKLFIIACQKLIKMGIADFNEFERELEEDRHIIEFKEKPEMDSCSDEYAVSNNLWISHYA